MRLFLSVLTFSLLAPLGVFAQALPAVEPLSVTLNPTYPRPYDIASITVRSSSIDLAASTIVITADGVIVGENTRSAQVELKGPGSRTTIQVKATTNGQTYEKTLTISPAEVALVLEPSTTAHPFYDGARLVAPQTPVRLVAIADVRTSAGVRVPSSALSYTWRLGNQILQAYSGLGKNVLSASAPVRYRDAQVSVTVATQDSSRVAQATVVVSSTQPLVHIYRDDPLLGTLFSKALLGSFALAGDEETFRAVPYFFGAAPTLAWSLNGTASGEEPSLTVRTAGASAGTAQINVQAKDTNGFESAKAALSLQFGAARGTGIFGF